MQTAHKITALVLAGIGGVTFEFLLRQWVVALSFDMRWEWVFWGLVLSFIPALCFFLAWAHLRFADEEGGDDFTPA